MRGLPRGKSAIEMSDVRESRGFELCERTTRTRARLAAQHETAGARQPRRIEGRQRERTRAVDVLAREFAGLAHVDNDGFVALEFGFERGGFEVFHAGIPVAST